MLFGLRIAVPCRRAQDAAAWFALDRAECEPEGLAGGARLLLHTQHHTLGPHSQFQQVRAHFRAGHLDDIDGQLLSMHRVSSFNSMANGSLQAPSAASITAPRTWN